ncbi:MAG: histidine triad nucleotide-binding protein [Bacteriovoracaceae bacterium]|jgi:histidine triad (HIT) family protein|nr:histidine triad nucleotide-binding protein [Bacteriovoracaceae bacterium]
MSIFQKIIDREIPATIVFENENILAFEDINAQAAIHIIFIHKKQTKNINELSSEHPEQLSQVFSAISEYTRSEGLEKKGFRVVTNLGENAGQTVFHTHFHLLSGERLGRFGS